MAVPTLAADRDVEGAVGTAPFDHQPQANGPLNCAAQVPLAEPREPLRQLASAAEAVVGQGDDRGDDLLRRRQFTAALRHLVLNVRIALDASGLRHRRIASKEEARIRPAGRFADPDQSHQNPQGLTMPKHVENDSR